MQREKICREFWRRIDSTPGVNYTARNPSKVPAPEDAPIIQFFELNDMVLEARQRGASQLPSYRRELTIVCEFFVSGSTEELASAELLLFVQAARLKIFEGGTNLGRLGAISEAEDGRILRPPTGENLIGVGKAFTIEYVDDVATD